MAAASHTVDHNLKQQAFLYHCITLTLTATSEMSRKFWFGENFDHGDHNSWKIGPPGPLFYRFFKGWIIFLNPQDQDLGIVIRLEPISMIMCTSDLGPHQIDFMLYRLLRLEIRPGRQSNNCEELLLNCWLHSPQILLL